MTWKSTLVAAVVMGLVAAAVVWYLERFESARLMTEIHGYLDKIDHFRAEYPDPPAAS